MESSLSHRSSIHGSPDLATAVLYEHEDCLESLRGAVVAAGAEVVAEIRLSELTAGQLEATPAGVLLVNLEAILDRKPDILDLVLQEQGNRRLILNDAAATSQLQGSDRARWIRHLAGKLVGHSQWLPPRPQSLAVSGQQDRSAAATGFEVWVLGASIGGPEAVRSFLTALDADCRVALLLAQHIGGDFVDTMCRQLASVSPLPARRAQHGDRIEPGQLLVVPVDERFGIDDNGRVALSPFTAPPAFSPCIDDVLRTTVDHFGARANAIIFSGMASDGVAGAGYLAQAGGQLWVQDPASCVVSSMVDGALATQQVTECGEPEFLARKLSQHGTGDQ